MNKSEIISGILSLVDAKAQIRQRERQVQAEEKKLGILGGERTITVDDDLESRLRSILPSRLVPSNVGDINSILWPFFYTVEFNTDTDLTISPSFFAQKQFRVSQESGFILRSIYRDVDVYDGTSEVNSAFDAPFTLTFRDNQSSRQINNNAFPVQMVGTKSSPLTLVAPYYFQPNATVNVELTTFAQEAITLAGNSTQRFVFHGYRVRQNELGKALTAVFGG